MPSNKRNGQRKPRSASSIRIPSLGYYYIVTDTKETEQNYIIGLRNSIPTEFQNKIVIKVNKTKTKDLVDEALDGFNLHPQYCQPWIIFDRDQVQDFDKIIQEAENNNIKVGWTNPCIEEWFSAYFGTMPTYQDSVSCCDGFSKVFKDKTKQEYSKSDKAIFEKLNRFGDEEKAIKIAQAKINEHDRNCKKLPSEMCPCTTVHLLVSEIKSKIHKT